MGFFCKDLLNYHLDFWKSAPFSVILSPEEHIFVGVNKIEMRAVRLLLLLPLVVACSSGAPGEPIRQDGLTYAFMEAEALPPMTRPRAGHALVEVAGSPLVIGGHTTGFLSTATAEYYHKGRWQERPTLYPHDTPFCLSLQDGSVLVGGGYESGFGIGQTWGVEQYDPSTRSFSPMPILDRKRAHASALELSDGSLVISGNWFSPDAVERYGPDGPGEHWQPVSEERSFPYILPMGTEQIWLFGGNCNARMEPLQGVVDVIGGEPFTPELFQEWSPLSAYERNVPAGVYTIGPWTYLLPARDTLGHLAPMVVSPEGFALLEMEHPLPVEGPWGRIAYEGTFWVDQTARTAWLAGADAERHYFLAAVEYGAALEGGKAGLRMYYSHPVDQQGARTELRLHDGRFVLAGGFSISNYEPSAAAYMLYPLGRSPKRALLPFALVALFLAAGMVAGLLLLKDRTVKTALPDSIADNGLCNRLVALMEERQLYRKKGLKIADVATELGTNTTYISACLSGQLGTSFRVFVNKYRLEHAKRLMKEHPQMRLSQVGDDSGFSNEKTFLRTFKAATGVTPTEWKKSI